MKKLFIIVVLKVLALNTYAQNTGTFIDARDGNTYKTIQIENQLWMAENINYAIRRGSFCYDNNNANCKKYGRLYNRRTLKNVCPVGWRVPTKDDFEVLLKNIEDAETSAYHAIINKRGNGLNINLSGWRHKYGGFNGISNAEIWWTSSSNDSHAWRLDIKSEEEKVQLLYRYNKWWAFSVRCIKN